MRQLAGGMCAVVRLERTSKKSCGSASPHVRFENFVRIEKITQDQIKPGEVFGKCSRKFNVAREKPGQRRGVERSNGVGVKPFFGQGRDVFYAEDLQMRGGETIAQQFYRGQGEDEIANGGAANDQDTVQVSNA